VLHGRNHGGPLSHKQPTAGTLRHRACYGKGSVRHMMTSGQGVNGAIQPFLAVGPRLDASTGSGPTRNLVDALQKRGPRVRPGPTEVLMRVISGTNLI
jgi:hypothetical protein